MTGLCLQAAASLVYMRPEDEFYHKHCTWSFTFPVASRPAGYEDLEQVRLCMLLTPAQIKTARCLPFSHREEGCSEHASTFGRDTGLSTAAASPLIQPRLHAHLCLDYIWQSVCS